MSVTRNRLSLLFHHYYDGTATEHEIKEMMGLIRKADGDAQLSALIKEAWGDLNVDKPVFPDEVHERIISNILRPEHGADSNPAGKERAHPASERSIFRLRYWAAAVIILGCFGVLWKWNASEKGGVKPVAGQSDIQPGGNRATLTLADGSVVSLDSTAKGAVIQQGTAKISKAGEGELVYKQTAFADAQSADAQFGKSFPDKGLQMNMIATPRGGQYQITLPDGTKAWLNASSSIRFPVAFANNERRVEVQGEVYFQVRKDKLRPFRVNFGTNEIEVLGTSFNVMNYKDEHAAQTTLEEGSLIVRSRNQESKLKPGEQASIAREGALAVAQVDVSEAIAWKDGLFHFEDAGIEEVMRQAARWYDIEVTYEGPVPKRQFTGTIERNLNISELMTMLQYAGVNYRIDGRRIHISK